jgi:hypothetical protein
MPESKKIIKDFWVVSKGLRRPFKDASTIKIGKTITSIIIARN